MSRSRSQMLGPIYQLVCEASEHLRDAHQLVPRDFNITAAPPYLRKLLTALIQAHEASFGGQFARTYRANDPVDLSELEGWVQLRLAEVFVPFGGDPDVCVEPLTEQFDTGTPNWAHQIVDQMKDAHRAYISAQVLVKILTGYPDQMTVVPPAPEGSGSAIYGGP